MKNLLSQLRESYLLAFSFLAVGLWLMAIPAVIEAVQHIVEYYFGMFQSNDGIQAGPEQSVRGLVAFFKVMSVIFGATVACRYFLHGNDLGKAITFSSSAKKSAALLATAMGLMLLFSIYLGPLIQAWLKSLDLGLSKTFIRFSPAIIIVGLVWPIQDRLLKVFASIFEDDNPTPISKKTLKVWSNYSTLVMGVSILPFMVLHYFLNDQAIDKIFAVQFIFLSMDSALVGLMAAVLGAAIWVGYREARSVF